MDAISSAGNRSIVIVAAPPAFCAGLDLKAILQAGSPETQLRKLVDLFIAFSHHPHPTSCYVGGAARAGGMVLACCADDVVAHPDATLMIPGESFYKPMALTLSPILAARRNMSLAGADTLPGRLLTAEAARSLGLIDSVSEDQTRVAALLAGSLNETRPIRYKRRRQRLITPAVVDETNARLDHAVKSENVVPLLEHLRKRLGSSS